MPPWPWTMAFGRPVVPDENSTNSGWSNATGRNVERPRLGEQIVPGERVRDRVLAVGDVHDVAQGGEGGADRRQLLAAVDRAVAEAVPADRQQHRRVELRESVDDAAGAELRRAAHPDRPEARRRRERDQRLGDVRHVGGDPVAGADAEPHEAGARARHLLAELRKRELDRVAGLGARDDRDPLRVVVRADQVLREVQPRAREPGRTGHLRRSRGRCCTARAPSPRRTPRSTTRTPAGRRRTSATAPRSPRTRARARARARRGSVRSRSSRGRPAAASRGRRDRCRWGSSGRRQPVPHAERDVARRPRDGRAVVRDQLVHRRPSCGERRG